MVVDGDVPPNAPNREVRHGRAARKATCLHLWESIPDEDKHCHTFSDFWHAYQHVFPAETHHCVGKETGETAHMERWNNTLRQRVGRYVRQTHELRNEM